MGDEEAEAAPNVVIPRSMPRIDPPAELILDSNKEANFRTFKAKWRSYYVLSRLGGEELEYQRELLLYTAGTEASKIIDNSARYAGTGDVDKTCDLVLEILEQYCIGERNTIHERYKFNTRTQLPGESFDAFYTELRTLASSCLFNYRAAEGAPAEAESPIDEMLRDRIVLGLREDELRKRLISQGNNLTLATAVRLCRSHEVTSTTMRSMSGGSSQLAVNAVRARKRSEQSKPATKGKSHSRASSGEQNKPSDKFPNSQAQKCSWCGKTPNHAKDQCPAKEAECRNCGKKGHYSRVCRSKRINEVKEENDDNFLFTGELVVGEVECWQAKVDVNGFQTIFKLDTGADGTVVSHAEPWVNQMKLSPPDTILHGPGGKELEVLGVFEAKMSYKGLKHSEKAYVIKNQNTSLLSRNACVALNLVTCHVNETLKLNDICSEFPKLFKGLGLLKGYTYKISLRDNITPTCIYTPRKIPHPLREKAKLQLQEMVTSGVISPVTEATDWCSGLVTIPKASGAVRLCVDLTGLNAAVKREIHPMATVEESLSKLGKSSVFSKLDANSGFWQINLEEESRRLTTFLSPFGRYCFNRLPFGVSSAPEIFQRAMSRLLEGVPGVVCHMDDILVHGKDLQTHDERLREVLRILQDSGLTLNAQKCEFRRSSLTFLGHIISQEGVRPDPTKVAAIQDFPTPTSKTDLRRINGMLNQMAKFIPNLAILNAPMRELLKEKREWIWGPAQEDAFAKVRDTLTSAETMAHYDPKLVTIVSTDASNIGLGATLMQVQPDGNRRPVMYASRSLTETEKNYAAIEKEALGTVWACERFDQFVRGMAFTIETDHKPLVPLMMSKELDQVPSRILRMRLRIMRYAPRFQYVQGKLHCLADALSRAPVESPSTKDHMLIEAVEEYAQSVIPSNVAVDRLKEAQHKDELCLEVIRCCREGWPVYKTDAYLSVQPYWEVQQHLTVIDDLLLYDDRIVVPSSERLRMLDIIHQAHQGIVKCRLRARQSVWWPRISTEIQEMVQNCRVCKVNSKPPTEPLLPSSLPERAWQRLGADLLEFQKCHYLLLVDYYSRWIEVRKLCSLLSRDTIEAMKSIFSVHGICEMVISDNGPQFASEEFLKFTEEYGFTHVTSSPRYPKANGEAERAVGTVKGLWRSNPKDPHLSLLTYRATPLDNGYTPSELLMGRQIQTNLPVLQANLMPHKTDRSHIVESEGARRQATKLNHDKHFRAKELPELKPDKMVYIRDSQKDGMVVKKVAPRSYQIQTDTGIVRRNRSALVDMEQSANNTKEEELQTTPKRSQDVYSPGSTRGAEGRAIRKSPQASPGGCRGSESTVAEGRAIRESPQARHVDSDHRFSRPQRSKRVPGYLTQDYELY